MRIAIADDQQMDAEQIQSICQAYLTTHCIQAEIDCFSSGEDLLKSFKPSLYSLIFLDIYMEQLNGIETARQIRQSDLQCMIIFLTSSREHALEAYPIHPFDYLLKPFQPERIQQVLDDAFRVLPKTQRYLELRTERRNLRLPFSELCYATSSNHYILFTTFRQEQIKCYMTFSELWRQLQTDPRFLQCNRGIALNMDYAYQIQNNCFLMQDGSTLPIRLNDRAVIHDAFIQYQFNKAKEGY